MRRVAKRILVIPEGWTEYKYAMNLKSDMLAREKQRSISVTIPQPNNENSAKQLLAKALAEIKKAKREKNPYDAIWLFFDKDENIGLREVFHQAEQLEIIQLAYSCISMEHWFLLHLEDSRQTFATSAEAKRRLEVLWQNCFGRPYSKTDDKLYDSLREHLDLALERSAQIERQAQRDETPPHIRNPYFTLHRLIGYFRGL